MFRLELPDVPIPDVNGFYLMGQTLQEACHYVFPAVFTPVASSWSYIAASALAIYNFKLPAIPSQLHLLTTASFHGIDLWPSILAGIHVIKQFLKWILWTPTSGLLGFLASMEPVLHGVTIIIHMLMYILFSTPYEELDQDLEAVPWLGFPLFLLRYMLQLILFPFLGVIRGFWAALVITNAGFIVCVDVALPTFFKMMRENHSNAFRDYVIMLGLAVLWVIILFLPLSFLVTDDW
jgi:hypothetical protein